MISPFTEKRMLQVVVALACMVPLLAGFDGVRHGGLAAGLDSDSHMRYLSGLLLGLGLGFATAIPHIERCTARIQLLSAIVFIGGLSRLYGFFITGIPGTPMQAALVMELVVTPLLCLWQYRVSRRLAP